MCVQLWYVWQNQSKVSDDQLFLYLPRWSMCALANVTKKMHTCYMKGVYMFYIGFLLQQMNQHKFFIKHANFITPQVLWVRSFVPG